LAKALGTGLRHPVTLSRIRVTHDELGKPGFGFDAILSGCLAQKISENAICRSAMSGRRWLLLWCWKMPKYIFGKIKVCQFNKNR